MPEYKIGITVYIEAETLGDAYEYMEEQKEKIENEWNGQIHFFIDETWELEKIPTTPGKYKERWKDVQI